MQLYRRPTAPQGFPSKKWETTRQAAERIIEAELKERKGKKAVAAKTPRSGSGKPRTKKKTVFPGIWKDYKALFANAQFEKCGFCESKLLATSYGDVEHYRPKSGISILLDDPNAQGQQQEASAAIAKRLTEPLSGTGYYWLAYDWSNYLLACSMCNGLKGTIFPVKNKPRAVPPLKTQPPEEPLLLNPFENKAPARHLKFQPDGFVMPKSAYGRATIETCGLSRDQLRKLREKIAVRVYELARDLRRPPNKRENSQLLRDCYEYGVEDAEYCGMVRSIIEEVAGISWEKLVKQRAKELALQSKQSRNAEKKKVIDEALEKMGRERYEHSASVRQIFEKTCGVSWSELISRHARQLARDFLVCKRDWKNNATYQLNWKEKFYVLARENLRHLAVVKEAYEKQSRMDWDELKAEVEAGFQFLWKLPADDISGSANPKL